MKRTPDTDAARMDTADRWLVRAAQHASVKMRITGADGHCHWANARWCEFVGQSVESELGRGWTTSIHPDDSAGVESALAQASQLRAPFHQRYRLRRHDGAYRWQLDVATPHFSDDGRFRGHVGSVIDIHEERAGRAALERLAAERGALLDGLIDCMPSGVVATDMEGKLLVNNPAASAITGVYDSDFTTDHEKWAAAYGAYHPDGPLLTADELPLVRALRGEVLSNVEVRFSGPHLPQDLITEASARPIRNADGVQTGALVLFTDISERRRAELRLRDSARELEYFRLIAEGAEDFIALCNLDRRVTYINPAGRAAVGLSTLDDVRATELLDYLFPHDLARATSEWLPALYRDGHFSVELEMRNFSTGEPVPILWRAFVLCDPSTGAPYAVAAFGPLLAERRRLEAQREHEQGLLRDSEASFRLITDVTPQILWTARSDGAIDFVNSSGLAYFGRSFEDVAGDGWLSSVHPDDLALARRTWAVSLDTGKPVELQYRFRRHDGEYRWQITRGVAQLGDDGRPLRWYGVSTDIEDLRRAQEVAESATQAKSQFLANMSHEIRTPMNGVIGMTSLLQDTALDAAQREYVGTIRASGEHLLAVINDILDFSKTEAGKLDLERYVFSLRGCVEEAMELVAGGADRKGVELILDAPPDLPRRITGDAGRLRQVLVNLLSNAIKFTNAGEVLVRVRVSVQAQADGQWRLRFAVQDSGIGIAPERMDRLFGVFSQLDASHARTHGGSGLGLAICKRLVELMGGRIWAESQPGVGSTFRFEIEAGMADIEASPDTVDFGGRRVLVVDDNATNRRVLRLMLESWGLAVTDAPDPETALRLVAADRFDVALLDFQMPRMSGVELAHVLRKKVADLPLMLLGSVSDGDEHPRLFAARMLKPVRQSTLFDQLAVLFGRAAPAPTPTQKATTTAAGAKPGATRPLRILVAEDNSVNQKVALRFLEKLGYTADLVGNGLEAVQAVERQTYDVVLMDVQMPEMDGLEATRQIRSRLKPGPHIVALTANALAVDQQRCREAGMDDYISKPIDLRDLAAALARAPGAAAFADYRPEMLARLHQSFDADGAREVIEAVAKDAPGQGAELLSSDVERVARAAHTLKSTCLLLGAAELGKLCENAERAVRQGQNDPAVLTEIAGRYQALVGALLAAA